MRSRYSYLIISVVFALGLFGALLVQLDGVQVAQARLLPREASPASSSFVLRPSEAMTLYLPILMNPIKPNRGIYGFVTVRRVPEANVQVSLLAITKTNFTYEEVVVSTTQTNAAGLYSFPKAPQIDLGVCACSRYYAVRYENTSTTYDHRLRRWTTAWLRGGAFDPQKEFNIGNFDILDMVLYDPADNATINIPYIFNYDISIFALRNTYYIHFSDYKTFAVGIGLDHSSQFFLQPDALPANVAPNTTMKWQLQVAQPPPTDVADAYDVTPAMGTSYYSRTLTITNP